MTPFQKLEESYAEVADLAHSISLLSWDQQTQMPPRGAEARGNQIATLEGILHERLTAPALGDLLDQANSAPDQTDRQRAWLREFEFSRARKMTLPGSLVKELALETSRAFGVWSQARKKSDFALFAPNLGRIVELKKQEAECYGYEKTPWNALVPDYERGLTADSITTLFAPLRDATTRLLDRILGSKQIDTSFLNQKWDTGIQREFGLRVARDLGYDMASGRQDIAAHPFCTTIGHGDVRITTRYSESRLLDALLGTIHEAGHAMYEQGLPESDARSPLFDAPGLGVHESQSRFWEIRIAHSRPFWSHYLPTLKQYFPGQLDGVDDEAFYRAANRVEPTLIRVEADEVCYNLHVIIRFELEVRIFNGELSVADLPAAWNDLYKRYLGIDVPNDAQGCLQDVHWAYGSFGYFPTYTVGNIYCAMLTEKMQADIPTMWDDCAAGRFDAILGWLRQNIHRHGKRFGAVELIEQATGHKVSCDALIRHLEGKYSEIY